MEIGTEISQQIKTSIKNKLLELGSYIDDELPEYILVMVANKRSKAQMIDDLGLFLGNNTEKFTLWLHNMLQKLTDATSITETEMPLSKEVPQSSDVKTEEKIATQKSISVSDKGMSTDRPRSPVTAPGRNKTSIKRNTKDLADEIKGKLPKSQNKIDERQKFRDTEDQRRRTVTSSVVKVPHMSSGRKRHHSSDNKVDIDEDDSEGDVRKKGHSIASIVKVKERGSSLPVSMQASSSLIKRAMMEAQESCSKLALSMGYDPSAPPILYSQDTESKQRQKELLLQQHRQLQRIHQEQQTLEDVDPEEEDKKTKEEEEEEEKENKQDEEEEDVEIEDEQDESDFSHIEDDSATKDLQEPEIELHVSDDETLSLDPAISDRDHAIADSASEVQVVEDKRVVAFADSQAGSDEDVKIHKDKKEKTSGGEQKHKQEFHRSSASSSSSSSRHKRHRAVKARKKINPKFIVTLEGVSSDYEDKFEEENDDSILNLDEGQRKLPLQNRLGLIPRMNVPFPSIHIPNPHFPPIQHPLPPRPFPPQNIMTLPPHPLPHHLHLQHQLPLPQPPRHSLPTSQEHLPYNMSQPPMQGQFIPSLEGKVEIPPENNVIPMPEIYQPILQPQDAGETLPLPQHGAIEEPTLIEDKSNERCVFWPNCAKGDACPFHHPVTACRTFPKCKFGDKCFFIHPPCKFDGRCTNSNCPFQHSTKVQTVNQSVLPANQPTKGLVNAPLSTVACKYHPTCTRPNCPFLHPSSKLSVGVRKPCRFGNSCTRKDCNFSHVNSNIPRESSAFKWVASQHISERTFAAPDSEVSSLVVK